MINQRRLAICFAIMMSTLVTLAATYPRYFAPTVTPPPGSHASAAAANPPAQPSRTTPPLSGRLPNPLSWSRLSPQQQQALAPFAAQWDHFSDVRKRKWLKITSRFSKMTPAAQKRLHNRMLEWVQMTPEQQRIARENYQLSKSVPPQAREKAWDTYKKLPDDQKKQFTFAERKNRRPTIVSALPTGIPELRVPAGPP